MEVDGRKRQYILVDGNGLKLVGVDGSKWKYMEEEVGVDGGRWK